MKLAVVSHTAHYQSGGRFVAWGPTTREISHLATLFDEVVHVAPVFDGAAPASALAYDAANISVLGIPPAGGRSLRAKIDVLHAAPVYVETIRRASRGADVLHVRCPSNVGLLGLLQHALAPARRSPRIWIKYAGDWNPTNEDPWSYWFQRWLIRRSRRCVATVNGSWPRQPSHIRTLLNPCLTAADLAEGREATLRKPLDRVLRLLFVGALEEAKGVGTAVEVYRVLKRKGLPVELDVVGDGTLRADIEKLQPSEQSLRVHGWVARTDLGRFYERAHVIVLPSRGEGWPKVLSEAMAYGVVPVASAVGSIAQYLEQFKTGVAIRSGDALTYAHAIERYAADTTRWRDESVRASEAASLFSYERYLHTVRSLLAAA